MTVNSLLCNMSVEVLPVYKECSHENESLKHLFRPYFIGPSPVDNFAGYSSASKRDPMGVRQSNRTRKVGSRAPPNPCTCATISGETVSVLSDTFSIIISHGTSASVNLCAHT